MALQIIKPPSPPQGVYFPQHGIEVEEIGIACRNWAVRYFPEVDMRIKDLSGQTIVRSQSQFFSRDISCDGEVITDPAHPGGVMAFTLGIAIGFANDSQVFSGVPNQYPLFPNSIILDDVIETQSRTGWRTFKARASSNPFI